jgi:hypothetical protein
MALAAARILRRADYRPHATMTDSNNTAGRLAATTIRFTAPTELQVAAQAKQHLDSLSPRPEVRGVTLSCRPACSTFFEDCGYQHNLVLTYRP